MEQYEEMRKELEKCVFELSGMISKEHHEKAKKLMGNFGRLFASIDCEYIKTKAELDAYRDVLARLKNK